MHRTSNSALSKNALKRQLNFLYRLEKVLFEDFDESIRLKFNVLGHRYEIPLSILINYPNTLLGEAKSRAIYHDYLTDEFVFNRHPQAFESIITFYQSDGNSLAKPEWMPSEMFYEELKFFRLHSSTLIAFYDQEIGPMIDFEIVPKRKFQRIIWSVLNYSTDDWKSELMRTIDFLLNLIALWIFVRDCLTDHQKSPILYWIEEIESDVLRPISMLVHFQFSTIFIDVICTVFFFIEICTRFCVAPTFYQIYSDVCFWLELVSILPNLFNFVLLKIQRRKQIYFYSSLTSIAVLRSLRIFRFARQITGLRVFLRSLISSIRELFHFFILLVTMILFFGEFVYLLEESIQTVNDGYWLTALTITSLGYGDVYPTHLYSRILMSLCSLIGLILVALPIPGFYHYFHRIYRMEKKKRKLIRYIYADQRALRI